MSPDKDYCPLGGIEQVLPLTEFKPRAIDTHKDVEIKLTCPECGESFWFADTEWEYDTGWCPHCGRAGFPVEYGDNGEE